MPNFFQDLDEGLSTLQETLRALHFCVFCLLAFLDPGPVRMPYVCGPGVIRNLTLKSGPPAVGDVIFSTPFTLPSMILSGPLLTLCMQFLVLV